MLNLLLRYLNLLPVRPQIITERTRLEILGPEDARLMLKYYSDNREHLHTWEPAKDDAYFTQQHWKDVLYDNVALFNQGTALKFSALTPERTEVIGVCNFTNIVRGAFQACNLGYSIAEKYQGKGLMYEIVSAGIDHVFSEIGLHRVMANYMPHNARSGALLERLGFEREGLAKSYLRIAGQWEDHVLTAKINPNKK
ncbi:MAG: ribosomal protein S5-alanine N-acetyltransferase [Pseudomonadota bacterium]